MLNLCRLERSLTTTIRRARDQIEQGINIHHSRTKGIFYRKTYSKTLSLAKLDSVRLFYGCETLVTIDSFDSRDEENDSHIGIEVVLYVTKNALTGSLMS